MKRFLATIMLALFLLNVLGYYGIYQGLMTTSADALTQQIDESLDVPGAQVTFKIALAVPYAVDSRGYEPAAGTFSYEGEIYQLVKQQLVKDTLYLVGVKDEQSSMWGRALADYVMSFGDTGDDSQESAVSQGFIKDFVSLSISITPLASGWVLSSEPRTALNSLAATFCASVVHPPERA